jgi:hypothetical protein
MGLRNTIAIKNESNRVTVSKCQFTNATGTDRIYEGKKETLVWSCNSVDEEAVFSEYFVKKSE